MALGAILGLCILTLVADAVKAVNLIQEKGFRPNTFYYHLGNGGHAYHVNNEIGTAIYFKCVISERGCNGRAILRIGGGFIESKEHNHAPDPDFVGQRHFRENLLHRIRTERIVTFEDVLNDARRDHRYSRRVRYKMNTRRLASAMARARNERFPPIPITLLDLTRELLRNNGVSKTIDETENMYAGSITATDGSHHVAFFSPRSLQFLSNLKTIQGDGTFRSRPAVPHSAQCFVIVTTWRNSVVPLGWILMERKSLPAYRAVFHLLKTVCPGLDPDVIISDWEYSQQRAWQEAFPNARIQGCLWHLARAFIKKAKKLGLMRYQKDLPHLLAIIRKCCVIPLLPLQYFIAGLDVIKQEARNEDVLLAYLLEPFFTYIRERWIDNPMRNEWMNFFKCMHRTNNSAEVHNKILRKFVGAYRPNVYIFIESLARLEHNAMLDTYNMADGDSCRKTRRWQSVYQDNRINALSDDLEYNIFRDMRGTLSNFLRRGSELVYGTFMGILKRNGNGAL